MGTLARRIFNVAVMLGHLPPTHENPAASHLPPKPHAPQIRPLEVEEVLALAQAMNGFGALALIQGFAGLRNGEACALRWSDIDFANGNINVNLAVKEVGGRVLIGSPKDDDCRSVPMIGHVSAALSEMAGPTPRRTRTFIFPNGNNMCMRPSKFAAEMKRAAKALHIDPLPTPHHLRSTAASLMARAGVQGSYISTYLGHGSGEMTRRYVRMYGSAHADNRQRLAHLVGGGSPGESVSG